MSRSRAYSAVAISIAFAGCSLLHHGDAPQRFLTALKQGDGVQASRIWLNMTPDDRANLSHGIGITPAPTGLQNLPNTPTPAATDPVLPEVR